MMRAGTANKRVPRRQGTGGRRGGRERDGGEQEAQEGESGDGGEDRERGPPITECVENSAELADR